jgi:hypothetical protein
MEASIVGYVVGQRKLPVSLGNVKCKDLEQIISRQFQLSEDHNAEETEWAIDSFPFRNCGGVYYPIVGG